MVSVLLAWEPHFEQQGPGLFVVVRGMVSGWGEEDGRRKEGAGALQTPQNPAVGGHMAES